MRKVLLLFLVTALSLAGCGRPLKVGPKRYETYGLLNASSAKSANVCYDISAGNVIWSIILIETIIFPVYFVGFSLFNPVRFKHLPSDTCGAEV